MSRVRELLRPLVRDIGVESDGWAPQTLIASIRRVVLAAMALWQVVMVLAVVATVGWSPGLVLGHVAIGVYALAALRTRAPAWVVPLAQAWVGLAAMLVSGDIDSLLVFAACWQINFAGCVAGLLVYRWTVVPINVTTALVISAVLRWRVPEWGTNLPVAIVVTQVSIIVAVRLGLPSLFRVAQGAARDEARAADAVRRTEIVHRVSAQVAEESRALHDTAINTLAAISAGGAAVADVAEVRSQCAHDVEVLRALCDARRHAGADRRPDLPAALVGMRGVVVHRAGLDDESLRAVAARMDPDRVRAVAGCVREAITNIAKHAGVDRAELTTAVVGDDLVVTVSDGGRGFDQPVPVGRGVATSILARAADAGVVAHVDSTPGRGTRVELIAPVAGSVRQASELAEAFGTAEQVIARLHRRTGLLWGAGVTAVSVVLTAAGGENHRLALYPMLAVMAAAWLGAYLAGTPRDQRWMTAGLTAATAVVFLLSAVATKFGTLGTVHWQALAPTGPFVLLLSYRPPWRRAASAVAVWALVIIVSAIGTSSTSANAAGIVLVGGVVGMGFTLELARFQALVSALGADAAAARQRAMRAEIAADAELEAQATYQRWLVAGLDDAIALLDGVATGASQPSDAELKQRCGVEESYLRQLVLVSPELVHLGHAMMPTLRVARDRDVDFRLRLGGIDAADADTAQKMADTVLRSLDAAPPGSAVNVTVFPSDQGLQLTMTGAGIRPGAPRGTAGDGADRRSVDADRQLILQRHFPSADVPLAAR